MFSSNAFHRLFVGFTGFALSIGSVFAAGVPFAFASTTDGTIDAANRYAWSENTGWIDFGTTNGDVHVTDSGLSGAALSENIGWIVLDDVTNNSEGTLGGYAWSENTGWISFAPTNGGVTISSSGVFSGEALSENIGWIIFDTDNPVTTDWRPASSRTSGGGGGSPAPTSGGSSGSGSTPPDAYDPIEVPLGNFGVSINGNAASTTLRSVTLTLRGGSNTRVVKLSETSGFPEGFQVSYPAGANQTTVSFTFSAGEGPKTIYAQFCTAWGNCSGTVSDDILLKPVPQPSVIDEIKEVPQTIVKEVKEVVDVLKPLLPTGNNNNSTPSTSPTTTPTETVTDVTVPEEAPTALQGIWNLSPTETIETFIQGSLPARLLHLAKQFPSLEGTLQRLGVSTVSDIAKLQGVRLTLAGLTERLGLRTPQPLAELSSSVKERMPTDVVFARVGGELIDLSAAFSVTEDGEIQQAINTIAGKSIQLVMRPENPASSIKGYLAFRANDTRSPVSEGAHTFLSRLLGASPVNAQAAPAPTTTVEERLLLLAFDYTDPDRDGIYTAEIQVPEVPGEYEIITVIDFEDPEFGRKELRLITVVDPEGYVYETHGGKETRIPGAVVSLYWLNPETNEYVMWPANKYQQRNPQTTDVRGTYSFLVPPGYYYLTTEAQGYPTNEGKPFEVTEGTGVHTNIELASSMWQQFLDWKVILLLIVAVLLVMTMYRGRSSRKG